MKFILGTKQNMTQVFREDGVVVPVTRIKVGPCVVTQVKNSEKDNVKAIQIGFGVQKKFRLNKANQGHLKDINVLDNDALTVRFLRDFRTDDILNRGDMFTVEIFTVGEKVQVTGTSKGKGFQGVVKRHGFRGGHASHGNKDQLRMPGSIGATGPQRVFKGVRMGGHMGDDRVTVKNLEIIEIHPEENELLIKGAVPGARGGLLLISTDKGNIQIETVSTEKEQPVVVEEVVVQPENDTKEETK